MLNVLDGMIMPQICKKDLDSDKYFLKFFLKNETFAKDYPLKTTFNPKYLVTLPPLRKNHYEKKEDKLASSARTGTHGLG
jgi:hypothetical protein